MTFFIMVQDIVWDKPYRLDEDGWQIHSPSALDVSQCAIRQAIKLCEEPRSYRGCQSMYFLSSEWADLVFNSMSKVIEAIKHTYQDSKLIDESYDYVKTKVYESIKSNEGN
jgi:hypothetical protein